MRHRALVYALEPVEVVGLAVACGGLRSRRWRATAGLCLGRGARTRALLLDAISAGQVVLEDVRAARLAGLRMVTRERSAAWWGARVCGSGGRATNNESLSSACIRVVRARRPVV